MIDESVWELTSKIPQGKVTTYKEIAKKLNTKAYRLVGQALKNNPDPINVPCYRVIRSDGSIGGYSGSDPENIVKKINLLKKDGIKVVNGKINLELYLYKF